MGFSERLQEEIAALRAQYPALEYSGLGGHWVLLPAYPLGGEWAREAVPVVFEVKSTHPGTPPYGFYVPADLTFKGEELNNRNASPPQPPFAGPWALLSWAPEDGTWLPAAGLRQGSNLLNWARGFALRFAEGR
jgi:hypothetical protein